MSTTVLVLGDSVPLGERTDADPWPRRLPGSVDGLRDATVRRYGGMGTSLADLAADVEPVLDGHAGPARTVVLVHAGHNDAQLSGDGPRVTEDAFREAAARVDRTLDAHPAVDRHAFVGLVPLLRLDTPGSVPFSEAQPERSLAYDDVLAGTVGVHLPVARPVGDWTARTEDGVHPNADGHAFLAERVASWLDPAGPDGPTERRDDRPEGS